MIKNELGLSVVELAIVTGIFAISALVIFVPQFEIQQQMINGEKKMARIAQLDTFKQGFLSSEISLRKSAKLSPDNDSLCPCILGDAFTIDGVKACTLNTCTANALTDFSYLEPQGSAIEKLAGTAAKPVYYDRNGGPCSGNAGQKNPEEICAYKIISRYKAHCMGDLSTCEYADYLVIYIDVIPTPVDPQMGKKTFQILYPVVLNYSPTIDPMDPQSLSLTEIRKIEVIADPGHASETPKFVFEKCQSSNTEIFEVKCYRFVNGIGQLIITPKKAGSGRVTLQVNDGGTENNLSSLREFSVTVIAP